MSEFSLEGSDPGRSRDYLPTATLEMLRLRAKLLQQIRAFFQAREFLEVETPIVSADTVVDRHLEPVRVTDLLRTTNLNEAADLQGCDTWMWLQTSPEFAMKRLLSAGARAIFQISKVFRMGERGQFHNPEFTMLEWYRVNDDLQRGMDLLGELVIDLLHVDRVQKTTYRDAFRQHSGIDPFDSTIQVFADKCHALKVTPPWLADHTDVDDWLNLLFGHCVQPNLGNSIPEIVYDWPASQAALAVVRSDATPVAERFELFVQGVELANGYHELTDPHELRQRNERVNLQRQHDGHAMLPVDSRLLNAMQVGLPASAGVALGIDRLLMVISGATDLSQVIAFPIDRA
jgi:lysyl-tRNA synthetase class 2